MTDGLIYPSVHAEVKSRVSTTVVRPSGGVCVGVCVCVCVCGGVRKICGCVEV